MVFCIQLYLPVNLYIINMLSIQGCYEFSIWEHISLNPPAFLCPCLYVYYFFFSPLLLVRVLEPKLCRWCGTIQNASTWNFYIFNFHQCLSQCMSSALLNSNVCFSVLSFATFTEVFVSSYRQFCIIIFIMALIKYLCMICLSCMLFVAIHRSRECVFFICHCINDLCCGLSPWDLSSLWFFLLSPPYS